MKKNHDVIVFGATSFVGKILCQYLLDEFGSPSKAGGRKLSWAIAGRSAKKLDELVAQLGDAAKSLDIIIADAADDDALRALCQQTRVVVSTVGPYALYGEPLVRACAEAGTDYCDLTGEAQWISQMIRKYKTSAEKSGARIVHCCGFDSIPSDLGVRFVQQHALAAFGAPCTDIKMRVKAMRGAASGGTVASMVNIIKEAAKNPELRRELANPYSLCADFDNTPKTRQVNLKGAQFDADFKSWEAPFVMAAINTRIVHRSHALQGFRWSEGFRYSEAMMMGRGLSGRARAVSFSAGLAGFVVGAMIPPARWAMEKFILPAPGEGPSPAAQKKGFFDFRFIGRTADGRQIRAKVTGDRDPGYGSTGKMLGEAAACLALDIKKSDVPGGFWTPSTALGEKLEARLIAHAGLSFERQAFLATDERR